MFGLGPRAIIGIVGGLLIASLVGGFLLWIHNKDVQIHRAQGQRNAAILFAFGQQVDLSISRVNVSTLTGAIFRQNDAVTALNQASARASQEAAEGLRDAERRHRSDEARLAAVRRPLTATTVCLRADEAAARAREALR